MKAIIFDASTLISLAMACLYDELRKLKLNFKGKFLITPYVREEVINKPLTIKRFQLEGIRIQQLVEEGVLEMSSSIVSDDEVSKATQEIMNLANSSYSGKDGKIKLIDLGEASCVALSNILTKKKIQNIVAVDERTLRSLCENPSGLKKHLERKMHTKISIKKENLNRFKGIKIIRSIELIYIAYKKGLTGKRNKRLLESLIYALRFKGCSISNEELNEIKRIG